jgi:hypothetical protein
LGHDLKKYLIAASGKESAPTEIGNRLERYWILLPCWLFNKFQPVKDGKRIEAGFLDDVLWGQFCLFLFVRVQDDLFDGQADSFKLLFTADHFLIDSERSLSGHFGRRSPFWRSYWDFLRETVQAIVKVDELQKEPGRMTRASLRQHARVSAIFKMGSAAVCAKFRRMKYLSHATRFADEMAIACQIVDDLMDVEEDLERGRYNYAANTLMRLGPRTRRSPRQPSKAVARSIVLEDGMSRVLTEVRRHLRNARDAIKPIGSSDADAYVSQMLTHLDKHEKILHEARVRLFLPPHRFASARLHSRRGD